MVVKRKQKQLDEIVSNRTETVKKIKGNIWDEYKSNWVPKVLRIQFI